MSGVRLGFPEAARSGRLPESGSQKVYNPRTKTGRMVHRRMKNCESVSFGHGGRKAARMVGVQHSSSAEIVVEIWWGWTVNLGRQPQQANRISNIWVNGGVGGQVQCTDTDVTN